MIDDQPPVLVSINLPNKFVTTDYGDVPVSSLGITVTFEKDLSGIGSHANWIYLSSTDNKRKVVGFLGTLASETETTQTFNVDGSASQSILRTWGDLKFYVSGYYFQDNSKNTVYESFSSLDESKFSDEVIETSSIAFPLIHKPVIQITQNTTTISEVMDISYVQFDIKTLNIDPSISQSYSLEGVDQDDFRIVSIDGSDGTITQSNPPGVIDLVGSFSPRSDGTASIRVYPRLDNRTEGAEFFKLSLSETNSRPVEILDTSRDPILSNSFHPSMVDEGLPIEIDIRLSGVWGTENYEWSISGEGVTSDDYIFPEYFLDPDSGRVRLGENSVLRIFTVQDEKTEGVETLVFSIPDLDFTASIEINDTSTGSPGSSSSNPASPSVTGTPKDGLLSKTYAMDLSSVTISSSDGGDIWTVATEAGGELLGDYDRLVFSDKTVALDFQKGDASYNAVMLIGAAFGAEFIAPYFSVGVFLFDSGQSLSEVTELIVDTELIEAMVGPSNEAWVNHVYQNVTGMSPDALTSAILTTYLDKGTYSKPELLGLAMEAAPLQNQIDLAGFQSAGFAYDPFTFL